eukprot:GHRR01012135.1.p1 GENE.GHRR01012135.1~~GHRR01012135.1.p1  ORF type:complete len:964 (+),score=341.69 GHRR01012135.1:177-3068(+)
MALLRGPSCSPGLFTHRKQHSHVCSPGGTRVARLAGLPRRTCTKVVNSCFYSRPSASRVSRPQQFARPLHFGSKLTWSPSRPGTKLAGPHITATIHFHGRRVTIHAALAGVADAATDARTLLQTPVRGNPDLVTGQLDNGLRYVILPNPTPPQRFEAHLEVHAGSVDERANEQGVAHLVEHVTFLGSKRRESLLGTGARANAYTDFHHTVFHVHAPLTNCITRTPMLPQVLEALAEIAFEPQFLPMRIEKERKAVLAEAQMMNNIDYRIDCQLLTYLHAENNLGCRFPIGKTEQVKTWEHSVVQNFWKKWYFPANVTLYVVGDLDRSNEEVKALIHAAFGKFQAGSIEDHGLTATALLNCSRGAAGLLSSSSSADGNGNGNSARSGNGNGVGSSNGNGTAAAVTADIPVAVVPDEIIPASAPGNSNWKDHIVINGDSSNILGEGVIAANSNGWKLRHPVRPPVIHKHGCGAMQPGEAPAAVSNFRHPLLQHFMLTVFCKLPVYSLKAHTDLKYSFMVRTILAAFQFRMNQRYVRADPPFLGIDLDISDSGREGCCVATLTITAQPIYWEQTIKVAVEEIRRLQRFGLTASEVERYTLSMLRDSAQLAQQANSIPHINSLDFIMESLALGHTIMNHSDAHEALEAVAATTTLEDVNALAASMLTFASDVGREEEMLEVAAQPETEGKFAKPGPTRATSIVACMPAYIDQYGDTVTVGGGVMKHSSGGMGASGHLDADEINLEELEAQSKEVDALQDMQAPAGAISFDVSAEQIIKALASPDLDNIEPYPDVELPDHLVDPEVIEQRYQELQPRFVPLDGELNLVPAAAPAAVSESVARPPTNAETGITQRRLSNGIRINYRHTDNEPKAGLLRIVAAGGRAAESREPGPGGAGAVAVATRTLSEGGAVGDWSREQVEAYCIANLIHSVMDSNDEFLVLDVHFAATNGGLQCAFELVHQILQAPR